MEKRQASIDSMVKPVRETLGKLDEGIHKLEKERKGDHASLKAQVDSLMDAKKELTKETANLVQRRPSSVISSIQRRLEVLIGPGMLVIRWLAIQHGPPCA